MLRHAVQVLGVVHHDGRVLAAHFQHNLLGITLARVAQEPLARRGRSGEADRVNIHMPPDRLARGGPPGQYVQHTARHAGLGR